MEKETETVDVVKEKPETDSVQIVVKEEQVDQNFFDESKLTAQSKIESPVVVADEVTAVENSEESADKGRDESGEKDEAEQVKEWFEEVNVEAVDEEKATMENVADVEVKKDTSVETAEKKDLKTVDVSESTDEARRIHEDEIKDLETVSADVVIETTEVKVPEVESKTQAFEATESASEVEVKAEENSEATEEAEFELQVKLEEKTVESECPEEVVLIRQDLVSEAKKKTEEVANSYPGDLIDKISAEAKHVEEEPSKDEEATKSKDKDVINTFVEEDQSIKEDALKQTDTEPKEKEIAAKIQEEMAEALETEPEVKESQEDEIRATEVGFKPKHSNNIMSKVKQSLVKAKKAITGKSPSSKTLSTEAKE